MRRSSYKVLGQTVTSAMLLVLLAAPATAEAQMQRRADVRAPVSALVALRLGNEDLHVDHDDSANEARIDSDFITIEMYDEFGPGLLIGISLGRLFTAQSPRPATVGMSLGGYSLGLVLDWRVPLLARRLSMDVHARYAYHDTRGVTDEQRTDLDWQSFEGRLGLGARLGRITLNAGGAYRALDGDERTFGTVDSSSRFSLANREGAYFGLDFNPDPGGFFGFLLERGDLERVQFYFQRYF